MNRSNTSMIIHTLLNIEWIDAFTFTHTHTHIHTHTHTYTHARTHTHTQHRLCNLCIMCTMYLYRVQEVLQCLLMWGIHRFPSLHLSGGDSPQHLKEESPLQQHTHRAVHTSHQPHLFMCPLQSQLLHRVTLKSQLASM